MKVCQKKHARHHTYIHSHEAEFVIVIVIDSKKICDFGTVHTIFEFQGRDLSFRILLLFHLTALLKNKK